MTYMQILKLMFLAAALLYAASCAAPLFGGNAARKAARARILGAAGFALHTLALGARYLPNLESPAGSPYGLVLFIAWIFAAIELALPLLVKDAPFSMLPAFALTVLPLACPVFARAFGEKNAAAPSFAALHGMLAAISYAALAACATFAATYLKQRASLRKKSPLAGGERLAPLEILERGTSAFAATSMLAMLASAAAGILAAGKLGDASALAIKFAAGSAVLALQIALCAASLSGALRGAKLAKLSVALFIFALAALIPIQLCTPIR
ncbi:MAG: hypothetical protein IJI37_08120 [Opitutales bacterium]|nr:hypothetical protein [Opitutales bacterium]